MCTGKFRLLFQLGTEKITLIYFYISAFCSLTDRKTDKISQLGAEKIAFPLNLTDILTDRRTDGRT